MMNDINDIVFKVYNGVLGMNYSKNEKKSLIKNVNYIKYIDI